MLFFEFGFYISDGDGGGDDAVTVENSEGKNDFSDMYGRIRPPLAPFPPLKLFGIRDLT